MKMVMMNGRKSTCRTYQRSNVSAVIWTPPMRANDTCSPNTGTYAPMFVPTVTAHLADELAD